MGTLIRTIQREIQKALPQPRQNFRNHVQVIPTVVPFVLIVQTKSDQIDRLQIQTKTKVTEILTVTIDTIVMATSKTTDATTIAILKIGKKTETTQTNNHVDFVIEQIKS